MTLSQLTRRAFLARSAALGAGLAAAALPALPARAAIPPSIVTIKQRSSGRFLDAWDDGSNDWSVVTRPAQNNSSQEWMITWDDSGTSTGTVMQLSSGRFLDAHEIESMDYRLVTRPAQANDSQRWQIWSIGGGYYNIIQMSNGRFVDAHEIAERDFAVVTRPKQTDATQQWLVKVLRNG